MPSGKRLQGSPGSVAATGPTDPRDQHGRRRIGCATGSVVPASLYGQREGKNSARWERLMPEGEWMATAPDEP